MILQLVSVVGAVLVLAAYLAAGRQWLKPQDTLYNAMNFAGAALLCWVAVTDRRVGFVILEATWALIALPPLLRGRRAP